MQESRLAGAQESRFSGFQTFKYGQCCPAMRSLATSQKSRFQAAKRSNMSSAIQQEDRSPDAQESRIRLRNVQI